MVEGLTDSRSEQAHEHLDRLRYTATTQITAPHIATIATTQITGTTILVIVSIAAREKDKMKINHCRQPTKHDDCSLSRLLSFFCGASTNDRFMY